MSRNPYSLYLAHLYRLFVVEREVAINTSSMALFAESQTRQSIDTLREENSSQLVSTLELFNAAEADILESARRVVGEIRLSTQASLAEAPIDTMDSAELVDSAIRLQVLAIQTCEKAITFASLLRADYDRQKLEAKRSHRLRVIHRVRCARIMGEVRTFGELRLTSP